MMLMIFIILMISFMIMMISSLISKKSLMDREKSSPFECGFDPKSTPRLPFSIHFFLIAIIFLIFDIEITILIPLIFIMKYTNIMSFMFISFMLLLILLMGLYIEWYQGALNWLF
uniref:NADH-ubiquinone oxidoreductase chain 3 n=1 Tax=Pselaphinae sp. 2 EF-2015 TaxID=1756856 RepID=A0A0S2M8G9_9COLE|nr:NADH deshydrogenase subunit 3 [Pselaphinae sp. 2 EF-2015]